jgi:hypothetical protein
MQKKGAFNPFILPHLHPYPQGDGVLRAINKISFLTFNPSDMMPPALSEQQAQLFTAVPLEENHAICSLRPDCFTFDFRAARIAPS